MAASHSALNGETVKIATGGRLSNGQHRLSAVEAANVAVPMILVREVPGAAMPTVDTGAKRTYSDALKLQGEDKTRHPRSCHPPRDHLGPRLPIKSGSVYPTALEINDFLQNNPRLRASAEVASKLASTAMLPTSISGLCHWLFSDLDTDDAGWFLARLADGDGLAADDPFAALRARIVKMHVVGGRVSETDTLALCVMAWNAHRAGETRSKLQMPRGGLTPENFPEPR